MLVSTDLVSDISSFHQASELTCNLSSNSSSRIVEYLPGSSVVSEVEEHGGEPVVNLIQSALLVYRLQDRLQTVRHSETHAWTRCDKNCPPT